MMCLLPTYEVYFNMSASASILPPALRERGIALLKQQCWHWGCDVRRVCELSSCNALMEYGFTRRRPPQGQQGATMYTLPRPDGYAVALWGFGLWFGDLHGAGIYLNRFLFDPQWTRGADIQSGVCTPEQLASARPSCALKECCHTYALMCEAIHWVKGYEQWALETWGLEYRQQCAASYAEVGLPAEQIEGAWTSLLQACGDEAVRRFGSVPALPHPCPPPVQTPGRQLLVCYAQRDRLRSLLRNAIRHSE